MSTLVIYEDAPDFAKVLVEYPGIEEHCVNGTDLNAAYLKQYLNMMSQDLYNRNELLELFNKGCWSVKDDEGNIILDGERRLPKVTDLDDDTLALAKDLKLIKSGKEEVATLRAQEEALSAFIQDHIAQLKELTETREAMESQYKQTLTKFREQFAEVQALLSEAA